MDDDLLPISGLQHLIFCPRQCALIHVERIWAENRLTVEGNQLHARVEDGETTTRGALRTYRTLPLVSRTLGLVGQADVVEIHGNDDKEPETAFPIEYKRGKPKAHDADSVQLCAQALCLEEMLGLEVPKGALFYGKPRRRQKIIFDQALREKTLEAIEQFRAMMATQTVPPPIHKPHCRSCSLQDICCPSLAEGRSAARWLERARAEA